MPFAKKNQHAAKKGERKGGRKKGVPNKATTEFRQAVKDLIESRADKFGEWLDRVAEDDPGKALDLVAKLAEYAAPKLTRTEHTGEGGGPVRASVEVRFV